MALWAQTEVATSYRRGAGSVRKPKLGGRRKKDTFDWRSDVLDWEGAEEEKPAVLAGFKDMKSRWLNEFRREQQETEEGGRLAGGPGGTPLGGPNSSVEESLPLHAVQAAAGPDAITPEFSGRAAKARAAKAQKRARAERGEDAALSDEWHPRQERDHPRRGPHPRVDAAFEAGNSSSAEDAYMAAASESEASGREVRRPIKRPRRSAAQHAQQHHLADLDDDDPGDGDESGPPAGPRGGYHGGRRGGRRGGHSAAAAAHSHHHHHHRQHDNAPGGDGPAAAAAAAAAAATGAGAGGVVGGTPRSPRRGGVRAAAARHSSQRQRQLAALERGESSGDEAGESPSGAAREGPWGKASGEQQPGTAGKPLRREQSLRGELLEAGSSVPPAAKPEEVEEPVVAPVELLSEGGAALQPLGELKLTDYTSYGELWGAIRQSWAGRLPEGTPGGTGPSAASPQLLYQDHEGDLLLLSRDEPWSAFVSTARRILIPVA